MVLIENEIILELHSQSGNRVFRIGRIKIGRVKYVLSKRTPIYVEIFDVEDNAFIHMQINEEDTAAFIKAIEVIKKILTE